jgi:hypothetical protein
VETTTYPTQRNERETAINRFDDSEEWDFFTSSPIVARRLKKLGWIPDPVWTGEGMRFQLPLAAITVRSRRGVEGKRTPQHGFQKAVSRQEGQSGAT